MRIHEVTLDEGPVIDSYGPGFFRIDGVVFEGAVLVLPGIGVRPWTDGLALGGVRAEARAIDLLLIGTGPEMEPASAVLAAELAALGIGHETMTTPAACRSYNLLRSEGRRVAAALVPMPGG